MITEDYVSFEVAKLLKEKGFNEPCLAIYTIDIHDVVELHHHVFPIEPCDVIKDEGEYLAPTHQMAMKWLREVHGTFIAINNDDLDFNWQCYDLINRDSTLDPKILSDSYAGYKTYEEAVEAALKYSLQNLTLL